MNIALFWNLSCTHPVPVSSSLTCAILTKFFCCCCASGGSPRRSCRCWPSVLLLCTPVETWPWAAWRRLRHGSSERPWPSFSRSFSSSPLGDLPRGTCRPSATRCCCCQPRSSLRRSGEKRCVPFQPVEPSGKRLFVLKAVISTFCLYLRNVHCHAVPNMVLFTKIYIFKVVLFLQRWSSCWMKHLRKLVLQLLKEFLYM